MKCLNKSLLKTQVRLNTRVFYASLSHDRESDNDNGVKNGRRNNIGFYEYIWIRRTLIPCLLLHAF